MGTAGMETAFKAVLAGSGAGPTIAVLAEYDALPKLGHGCGHNLIATSALGAGLALTEVLGDLDGSVWVLGTPAEESAAPNAGGKVHMVRAGIFDDVDASIMFHPAAETTMTDERSLAARGFEFYFHGKAAHAAGAPEDGINALDAVVAMYNAVSMLRQQVKSDVRIHGIILAGGAAANIIPDYAAIRYRTRSDDADYLEERRPARHRLRRGRRPGDRLPPRMDGVHAALREHGAKRGADAPDEEQPGVAGPRGEVRRGGGRHAGRPTSVT